MREYALRAAMLEQAISDFTRENVDGPVSLAHAEKTGERLAITWIFGDEQDYAFSFDVCCELRDLDPDKTRELLIARVIDLYDK